MADETTRRNLLRGAAAASIVAAGGSLLAKPWLQTLKQPRTAVSVLNAQYDEASLVDLLIRGLAQHPETLARAKGGRVVLKPNLVEVHVGRPINTDARLVGAAIEAFRHHGAGEVIVAEGPGHHRDMDMVLVRSGLSDVLHRVRATFTDLNVDAAAKLELAYDFTKLGHMNLAATAATADLLVSMPKLKTHHWVGATLSLKNLFGTVPGSVYGWPKNPLHYAGIEQSILDIWQALQPGFAIVDGVVGMQGDGPILGDPIDVGVVVLGSDLPAVDATCARIMGLDPDQLGYLRVASHIGGTTARNRIDQRGDVPPVVPFAVLPQFEHLRA